MHIRNPVEWFLAQFEATAEVGSALPAEYWPVTRAARAPAVREIKIADLRLALAAGLQDFAAARTNVIFLCLIYPVVGLFLAAVAAQDAILPLLFPIASGFALVGPFFAIGLYEMSRRREVTGKTNWLDVFKVIRSPSIGAIFLLGAILIGLFLLWLVVAQSIYNVTLGPLPPSSVLDFITSLFTTTAGWAMIFMGMAAGAIFAVAVLAISVVSFPLLLDRPVGLGVAIRTSILAVWRNPVPLAVWGLIIAFGLFLGSLPCFIGLIVVLPILGHSTWHLYRRLVRR